MGNKSKANQLKFELVQEVIKKSELQLNTKISDLSSLNEKSSKLIEQRNDEIKRLNAESSLKQGEIRQLSQDNQDLTTEMEELEIVQKQMMKKTNELESFKQENFQEKQRLEKEKKELLELKQQKEKEMEELRRELQTLQEEYETLTKEDQKRKEDFNRNIQKMKELQKKNGDKDKLIEELRSEIQQTKTSEDEIFEGLIDVTCVSLDKKPEELGVDPKMSPQKKFAQIMYSTINRLSLYEQQELKEKEFLQQIKGKEQKRKSDIKAATGLLEQALDLELESMKRLNWKHVLGEDIEKTEETEETKKVRNAKIISIMSCGDSYPLCHSLWLDLIKDTQNINISVLGGLINNKIRSKIGTLNSPTDEPLADKEVEKFINYLENPGHNTERVQNNYLENLRQVTERVQNDHLTEEDKNHLHKYHSQGFGKECSNDNSVIECELLKSLYGGKKPPIPFLLFLNNDGSLFLKKRFQEEIVKIESDKINFMLPVEIKYPEEETISEDEFFGLHFKELRPSQLLIINSSSENGNFVSNYFIMSEAMSPFLKEFLEEKNKVFVDDITSNEDIRQLIHEGVVPVNVELILKRIQISKNGGGSSSHRSLKKSTRSRKLSMKKRARHY